MNDEIAKGIWAGVVQTLAQQIKANRNLNSDGVAEALELIGQTKEKLWAIAHIKED